VVHGDSAAFRGKWYREILVLPDDSLLLTVSEQFQKFPSRYLQLFTYSLRVPGLMGSFP
jgi:hypothetical protein